LVDLLVERITEQVDLLVQPIAEQVDLAIERVETRNRCSSAAD
jgi:hypothetical protein